MELVSLGPLIGKFKLSNDIIKHMISVSNRNNYDVSHKLVGRIEEQLNYPIDDLDDDIYEKFSTYISKVFKDKLPNNIKLNIEIEGAWINYQKENEYNPLHSHCPQLNCSLSSVLYLEIPNIINDKSFPDGYLHFSTHSNSQMENHEYFVLPEGGDFYIFPYSLNHIAYPFKGDGIRKSISINAVHKGIK